MAGRTSIGHTPGTGGGDRPELRPGEAASTPPGLNQPSEALNRLPPPPRRGANWLSPPSLSPLAPHRTPPPVPVGSPAKAQARRGDGHAAGPEPRNKPIASPCRSLSPCLSDSLAGELLVDDVRQGEGGSRPPSQFNITQCLGHVIKKNSFVTQELGIHPSRVPGITRSRYLSPGGYTSTPTSRSICKRGGGSRGEARSGTPFVTIVNALCDDKGGEFPERSRRDDHILWSGECRAQRFDHHLIIIIIIIIYMAALMEKKGLE